MGYYFLHESSPLIGAGVMLSEDMKMPEFDIAGNPRIVDGRISMGAFEFYKPGILDTNEPENPPILTALLGNFPNPFNPSTTISFVLSSYENVSIDIFNVRGQLVRGLVSGVWSEGSHEVIWNGTDDNGTVLGSGLYFYRFTAGDIVETRKMLLLK